jgi:hypothetical protein
VAGGIISFAGLGIALAIARYLRWLDLREPGPEPTLAPEADAAP